MRVFLLLVILYASSFAENYIYQDGRVEFIPANRSYIKLGLDTFMNCYLYSSCKKPTYFNDTVLIYPKGLFQIRGNQKNNGYATYIFLKESLDPNKSINMKSLISKNGIGFDGLKFYNDNKFVPIKNRVNFIATFETTMKGYVLSSFMLMTKNKFVLIDIYMGQKKATKDMQTYQGLCKQNLNKIMDTGTFSVNGSTYMRVVGCKSPIPF
jgi:hypothetical protein